MPRKKWVQVSDRVKINEHSIGKSIITDKIIKYIISADAVVDEKETTVNLYGNGYLTYSSTETTFSKALSQVMGGIVPESLALKDDAVKAFLLNHPDAM